MAASKSPSDAVKRRFSASEAAFRKISENETVVKGEIVPLSKEEVVRIKKEIDHLLECIDPLLAAAMYLVASSRTRKAHVLRNESPFDTKGHREFLSTFPPAPFPPTSQSIVEKLNARLKARNNTKQISHSECEALQKEAAVYIHKRHMRYGEAFLHAFASRYWNLGEERAILIPFGIEIENDFDALNTSLNAPRALQLWEEMFFAKALNARSGWTPRTYPYVGIDVLDDLFKQVLQGTSVPADVLNVARVCFEKILDEPPVGTWVGRGPMRKRIEPRNQEIQDYEARALTAWQTICETIPRELLLRKDVNREQSLTQATAILQGLAEAIEYAGEINDSAFEYDTKGKHTLRVIKGPNDPGYKIMFQRMLNLHQTVEQALEKHRKAINPLHSKQRSAFDASGQTVERGHGPSMVKKKQSIADAKAETTARPAKVRRSREGKSGLPVYVDKRELEDFKAIAAAKGKGAQQYLEEFISSTVVNNAHLIPKGRELLKGPQRRRSFADRSLEQENRRLKAQLREAGIKPR